jgi:hypothetical protein
MKQSLKARYQARFGIKQALRGYQLRAARVGTENSHYALLMDPRLGKTRIDIAVAGYRWKEGQVTKWVIICPAIAKDVWATEIRNTLDIPHTVETVEGKAEERRLLVKGFKTDPGVLSILIINPEATWRVKKVLYKTNPEKITIDESHRIKNHAAKQSKTAHVLGKRAQYRCIMTGTFMSTPTDVFSQYKFLDPGVFGERWKQSSFRGRSGPTGFLERYVESYGFGGHKPKTFKNLDELEQKVSSIAFQLTREEAGGFPAENYQTIHFPLTNPALRHYKEMEAKLKTEVKSASGRAEVIAEIVLTKVLRLQQITGGFLPVHDLDENQLENVPLGDDRIQALRGLVSEYPQKEPLVIYCKFRYELSAVIELMGKMDRSVNFIAGGMKPGERDKAKADFQAGKVDTCVVQIRAGGIAIDLSRSDYGIFYSMTNSFIDYEQAKARIISRRGGHVWMIHLAAEGTTDEDIITSVIEKKELANLVMKRIL